MCTVRIYALYTESFYCELLCKLFTNRQRLRLSQKRQPVVRIDFLAARTVTIMILFAEANKLNGDSPYTMSTTGFWENHVLSHCIWSFNTVGFVLSLIAFFFRNLRKDSAWEVRSRKLTFTQFFCAQEFLGRTKRSNFWLISQCAHTSQTHVHNRVFTTPTLQKSGSHYTWQLYKAFCYEFCLWDEPIDCVPEQQGNSHLRASGKKIVFTFMHKLCCFSVISGLSHALSTTVTTLFLKRKYYYMAVLSCATIVILSGLTIFKKLMIDVSWVDRKSAL